MNPVTFPWGHSRRFNAYKEYFVRRFGQRVQKLSVHGGFTCPNRDGRLGHGGCHFCNNDAFTPAYCEPERGVAWQLEQGKAFHARRYRRASQFLAYFQCFSNTYASIAHLQTLYREALAVPEVVGLIIGTRPDCVSPAVLDMLAELAREAYVCVEYGVEATDDAVLRRVNRGHDYAASREAIEATAQRGLAVGAHVIVGLPGISQAQFLENELPQLNALPLTTIKFHQLQIMHDTPFAAAYERHPEQFALFETAETYLDFMVKVAERLNPTFVVERFFADCPAPYLVAPHWGGLKTEQLVPMFEKRLEAAQTWQGKHFAPEATAG